MEIKTAVKMLQILKRFSLPHNLRNVFEIYKSPRLVRFAMQYINYELQRCLKASEGGPFEVDIIVQTTATYGDRFRPVIKHRSEMIVFNQHCAVFGHMGNTE